MKRCKVLGCDRVVKAKDLCNPHYIRQRKYGSPSGGDPKLHRNRKPRRDVP